MLRFTIRDVLWLTLVVALILGWWADHQLSERRHRREKTALQDENALMLHEMTNPWAKQPHLHRNTRSAIPNVTTA